MIVWTLIHVPGQPTPSQSTWLDQRVSSWPKLANQLASPRNFQLESWEPESVKWPRGAEPERRDQARAGIHAATNRSQVQAEVLGGQKRHRKAKKKKQIWRKRQGDRGHLALAKIVATVIANFHNTLHWSLFNRLMCVNSFHPHSNPIKRVLLSLVYRWGNWGTLTFCPSLECPSEWLLGHHRDPTDFTCTYLSGFLVRS